MNTHPKQRLVAGGLGLAAIVIGLFLAQTVLAAGKWNGDLGVLAPRPGSGASKVADRQAAHPNTAIHYTITFDNSGMNEIPDAQMSDPLPANLSFVDGSLGASKGTATYQNGVVAWTGTLSSMEQVSVTFSATVSNLAPLNQPITNTAVIHIGSETFFPKAAVKIEPYQLFCPLILNCPTLFKDDFSNQSSNWGVADNSNYQAGYSNGGYHILVRTANLSVYSYPPLQAANYAVAVDVTNPSQIEGAYGIEFGGAADLSSGYVFVINAVGNYAIMRHDPTSGWSALIAPASPHPALKTGSATNRLKIERNGASIAAYANGELLANISDSLYMDPRYIGLFASTGQKPNLDIYFDNFIVDQLACGTPASRPDTTGAQPASFDRGYTGIQRQPIWK